jgi:NAD-dependent SIR2 family protein deacetylase
MIQQSKARALSAAELQRLCDECKLAMDEQQDADIKQAMVKVCDACRQVKAHVPELIELRRHLHEMNEHLPDHVA